jgi:hypothetical protein
MQDMSFFVVDYVNNQHVRLTLILSINRKNLVSAPPGERPLGVSPLVHFLSIITAIRAGIEFPGHRRAGPRDEGRTGRKIGWCLARGDRYDLDRAPDHVGRALLMVLGPVGANTLPPNHLGAICPAGPRRSAMAFEHFMLGAKHRTPVRRGTPAALLRQRGLLAAAQPCRARCMPKWRVESGCLTYLVRGAFNQAYREPAVEATASRQARGGRGCNRSWNITKFRPRRSVV